MTMNLRLKGSPDQPRDEQGRFAGSGASAGGVQQAVEQSAGGQGQRQSVWDRMSPRQRANFSSRDRQAAAASSARNLGRPAVTRQNAAQNRVLRERAQAYADTQSLFLNRNKP